jgi:hypothetical protein
MSNEQNKLKAQQAPLLELWHDKWSALRPDDFLINSAKRLRPMLEGMAYRSAFNKNEDGRILYTELRYMLLIMSKSKLAQPRRLTWRERITGRLSK